MRTGGVFHPDFFYAPRRTTGTTQLAGVEIYDLDGTTPGWEPGVGNLPSGAKLIWKSEARVQPNKDWRARPREVQYEYDATHAIRVQVPIGKNLAGAKYEDPNDPLKITEYGPDVDFIKDMVVRVVSGPVQGFETSLGDEFTIRNAHQSQNLWLYNLLCDTKTGGRTNVG